MKVKKIVVGPLAANCYVVYNDKKCLVVDPGADYEKIKNFIGDRELEGILITHYHHDHVGALTELIRDYCTVIYNYRTLGKRKTDSFSFEVMANKGHREDCVSFIFEDFIFTGDFIFKDSIGRTDLEGGSIEDMKKSLEKFKQLGKKFKVYPGHGDETTVKKEISTNPFLKNIDIL